jgi:hypothetical protein
VRERSEKQCICCREGAHLVLYAAALIYIYIFYTRQLHPCQSGTVANMLTMVIKGTYLAPLTVFVALLLAIDSIVLKKGMFSVLAIWTRTLDDKKAHQFTLDLKIYIKF